jgi:hypothetical protein
MSLTRRWQQFVDRFDPVPNRPIRPGLKMRDATDVGGENLIAADLIKLC